MAKQPEKELSDLDTFRAEKDHYFATARESPLSPAQKRKFKGLSYFPDNPELVLKVDVEKFDERTEVSMQTSTGSTTTFKRYGRFRFQVEGQDAELTIYQVDHGFFLPFADSLAGEETYGAGRYLEPVLLPDGKFQVDFNLAYNPYCAYNDYYSCPLTPAENRLKVPVRAGEKLPEGEWVEHL